MPKRTNKEVQFIHDCLTGQFTFYNGQELKDYHRLVTIPKGVRVTNKTACGVDNNYNFVDEFEFVDNILIKMDLETHGANVPKEFVED